MFTRDLAHVMRVYLAEKIASISPLGARKVLTAFRHFERHLYDLHHFSKGPRSFGISDLTFPAAEVYRRALQDSRDDYNFSALRGLFRFGWRERIRGFDERTYEQLAAIEAEVRRKRAGARHQDPKVGALSWEEQVQIDQAIRDEIGDPEDRAVVYLFQQLGIRPDAAVLLRRKHLFPLHFPEGSLQWRLNVPQVKRPGGLTTEAHTRTWKIRNRLAELLLEIQPDGEGDPEAPLLHFLSPGNPHADMSDRMKRWADLADLTTKRVKPEEGGWRNLNRKENWGFRAGGPPRWSRALAEARMKKRYARLNLFPYRFRRTIATNLAELGADVEEIAAILGDKTLAMAALYADNSPAIVDVLARTLDRHPEWMEVLTLFRGKLASEEDRAFPVILGGAPQLSGFSDYADIGVIGHCRNPRDCDCNVPLDAYPCNHFRPLPNREVHERQLDQVQREVDDNLGRESDRMAGVLRRQAGAILQVINEIVGKREGALQPVVDSLASRSLRRRKRVLPNLGNGEG